MKERESVQEEELVSSGKILFLTKDLELLRFQLGGRQLSNVETQDLMEAVSTDEIIPNRAARLYTGSEEGYLGHNALTGLRGGIIEPGDIEKGNFHTLVAGPSFGKGSSRIHAPLALQEAGIKIIIAKTERILTENCVNCGIQTVNPDSETASKLISGDTLPKKELTLGLSEQSGQIMESGGLLPYLRNIEQRKIPPPEISNKPRPMTIAEKIIAKNSLGRNGTLGVTAVSPGESVVAIPDRYYGYELQSPPARKALKDEFGDVKAKRPDKLTLHNDHTAFLHDKESETLRREHQEFARQINVLNYEADPSKGASAICHTRMLETHALPGELILGNDSHTCTVGALNNLAVGKGALDLAGAIGYDLMVMTVPETIKVNLSGKLNEGVTAKDFMLWFGSTAQMREERLGSGRVFEFVGATLEEMPFDEQIKLTNMSIELLGFSGVIEPNSQMVKYLKEKRGLSKEQILGLTVKSDPDALYSHVFDIDLSKIEPTVSEPGDTQNGIALSEIENRHVEISESYIGSCTHGTPEDLRLAAEVLKGRKVSENVQLFVQASSTDNLREAVEKGYIKILEEAGATMLPIGCGACMAAATPEQGLVEKGKTAVSSTNRNFHGRMGPGDVYLASVPVSAASAVAGYICGPDKL